MTLRVEEEGAFAVVDGMEVEGVTGLGAMKDVAGEEGVELCGWTARGSRGIRG